MKTLKIFLIFIFSLISIIGVAQVKAPKGFDVGGTIIDANEVRSLNGINGNIKDTLDSKVRTSAVSSSLDEFYNKTQSNARFINEDGDTITGIINIPTAAAGTNNNQAATMEALQRDKSILQDFNRMSFPVKTIPMGYRLNNPGTSADLISGTVYLVLQDYIYSSTTISSIKGVVSTQGAFTDNGSVVGIYTYSGGIYTKVSEVTGIYAELQKAAGSIATFTLSTPYNVPANTAIAYAILYVNNSSQTTAPRLYNSGTISGVYNMIMGGASTTLAKPFATLAGQSSLPATIAASSTSQGTYPITLMGF